MNDRQAAIDDCSCPRGPEEVLRQPKCPVENAAGTSRTVLFVHCPPGLYCKQFVTFGSSHICNCKQRLLVYQTYGI